MIPKGKIRSKADSTRDGPKHRIKKKLYSRRLRNKKKFKARTYQVCFEKGPMINMSSFSCG